MSVLRPSVLVVDGYAPFLEAMDFCLPFFGYEPLLAPDEAVARQVLAAVRADVLLVDIGLPAYSGLGLCRRLGTAAGGVAIPVVLLSRLIDPEIVERAHAAGAAKLIGKPFLWSDLLDAIATATRVQPRPGDSVLPVACRADCPQF
jgi:CheY-like chemotaxis protein